MHEILHKEVGTLPNGAIKIKFTNTDFNDIILTIGKVSFEDQGEDGNVLHYEYDVIEHKKDFVKEDLDKLVGDFVMQSIMKGLEKNDLIYTGGIDDDREADLK
jgi:hypothetical protein